MPDNIADTYTTDAERIAAKLGREHGLNAASWYFDGNTSMETYRATLAGIDAGDPEVLDTFPSSPLSAAFLLMGQDSDAFDDVCTAYEQEYSEASAGEIERVARYHVDPDDDRGRRHPDY